MKTEALLDMLSRGAGAAPHALAVRRVGAAMAAGVVISALATLLVIGFVPRTTLAQPGWWLKLVYALALAGGAAWWLARQGQPAQSSRWARAAVLVVVLAMALVGLVQWVGGPVDARLATWLGHSSRSCPTNILMLSLPALAASLWAVRGLAPTDARATGLAAGALAGAVGATGYTLGCSEVAPSFVATWYTLGIALTAALGAWLGPRVLRW